MEGLPILAFSALKSETHLPDPRSIIQIAVSDYRNSNLSDKELAEHICNSLSLMMADYDLVIASYKKSINLVFIENKN
jgi:hypothetical protein